METGGRDDVESIVEPQVAVTHDGIAPKFQLFNMQFNPTRVHQDLT
jgi:hypothetical protein